MKNRRLRLVMIFTLIICIVIIIFTLITNSGVKSIMATMDTRLLMHEMTVDWVKGDIYLYLTVKDEKTYQRAKTEVHMEEWLKTELFGSRFNIANFQFADKVSYVDAQYTIEDEEKIIVYLLAHIESARGSKVINFLVYVKNNTIFDIHVY